VKLGTIDIGTNTTLLLVAEGAAPQAVRVLADRSEITRLGRGIGTDGRLHEEGIHRTLEVLRGYAALAKEHQAPLLAVGTEALRRAPNRDDFLQPAAAILGAPVEVITGTREAELTYRAAATSFPELSRGHLSVVDIGGGSTEVILARDGQLESCISLPLGSVRLTEAHLRHDPPTPDEISALLAAIASALAGLPRPAAGVHLVGTAGTVTSLAAMAQGLPSYDPDRVHGFRLSRAALDAECARLGRLSQAERERIVGLDPRRADVIFAGANILRALAERFAVEEIRVSDRGIRWGLWFERLATR